MPPTFARCSPLKKSPPPRRRETCGSFRPDTSYEAAPSLLLAASASTARAPKGLHHFPIQRLPAFLELGEFRRIRRAKIMFLADVVREIEQLPLRRAPPTENFPLARAK